MLLHLSFNDSLEGILLPKQPDTDPDKTVGPYTETGLPPRICFAPTIQQCFSAIYPNISHLYEEEGHKELEFQLYVGVPDSKTKYIPQDEVLKNVWDAHVTGEVCVTTPIKVIHYLTLKIMCLNEEIFTAPFNNNMAKRRFVSPKIAWATLKIHRRLNKLNISGTPSLESREN